MKGALHIPQVLIQWENTDISEATWENASDIQNRFPHFNIEGKVDFDGEVNVTSANKYAIKYAIKDAEMVKAGQHGQGEEKKLVTGQGHLAHDL